MTNTNTIDQLNRRCARLEEELDDLREILAAREDLNRALQQRIDHLLARAAFSRKLVQLREQADD